MVQTFHLHIHNFYTWSLREQFPRRLLAPVSDSSAVRGERGIDKNVVLARTFLNFTDAVRRLSFCLLDPLEGQNGQLSLKWVLLPSDLILTSYDSTWLCRCVEISFWHSDNFASSKMPRELPQLTFRHALKLQWSSKNSMLAVYCYNLVKIYYIFHHYAVLKIYSVQSIF